MAGALQPELACRAQVEHPGLQDPVLDQKGLPVGEALAVEGLGTLSAPAMRIVDDVDAGRQHALAELVLEKADAARDPGAVDGPGQMADQAVGYPRIEDDRHLAGCGLTRIESLHRLLPRPPTYSRGRLQIGAIDSGGEIIVALHGRAFARQDRNRDAGVGADIAVAKAVGGGER